MKLLGKIIVLLFLLPSYLQAQNATQTIRGSVIDEASQEPLSFVNVVVRGTDPVMGVTTDIDGKFIIANVPIGRYDIEISYLGYEPYIQAEILITTAKEVYLEVAMKESIESLGEVVVRPDLLKEKPINSMAIVGARMLSVEEASRYAGGFDDPARLATSFPGVSSSVGNNAIAIRGNSPSFLQWKIEEVEIPNPNHFANLGAFGGGGLTALSSNLLANSDFYTGAFTAEYNNALSGVFDIRMRSGNNDKFEHSIELGVLGVDFTSEGPLSKKTGASYLINYRYSTLGLVAALLPEDAGGTNYQDLSFKVKIPTSKAGVFSIWGIGLIDRSGTTVEKDSEDQYYYQDKMEQDVKQYMGAAGINHRLILKKSMYVNSTLAFSTNGIDLYTKQLRSSMALTPLNEIKNTHYNVTLKSYVNKKFSAKHTNRTGITVRGMQYNVSLKQDLGGASLETLVEQEGFTALASIYSNSLLTFNKLTLNLGVNAQLFTLNKNYTIEPRAAFAYQAHKRHQISLGYGLHSRIEALNIYFAKTPNASQSEANRTLDFSKAHHFVLAYDWNISSKIHVKVEPYFQYLFDIPVIENTTFSLLNLQNNWFVNDAYKNLGSGQNYGLDLTLEQYMTKGFYFMLSGSIFNSQYKTNKEEWYNTRYNKNYLVNALIGKEFHLGKNKQGILGINLKASIQGGDRYSKIDNTSSALVKDVVYNETTPFTEQTSPAFLMHATVNYEWYTGKISHKLALKILNVTNFKEFQGHRYNLIDDQVEEQRESLIIPNLSYKISF
ncbi:MAG: TonB-dependent receptor [Aureispira sp.]